MLYNMLKKLIERKYYAEEQTIIDLLNNFATFSQISIEQYSELMLLADEKYRVVVEEVVENVTEDNIKENVIENGTETEVAE